MRGNFCSRSGDTTDDIVSLARGKRAVCPDHYIVGVVCAQRPPENYQVQKLQLIQRSACFHVRSHVVSSAGPTAHCCGGGGGGTAVWRYGARYPARCA